MQWTFRLIPAVIATAVLAIQSASGSTFINGSFESGDFTGWQVAGSPVVLGTPPDPLDGNSQALINSTGENAPDQAAYYQPAASVTADTLQTFLGLSSALPGTGQGAAINGQAIQQSFTTSAGATITFSYRYESRETPGNNYDETGYVLNGVFHPLVDSLTPGQSTSNATGFFTGGLAYRTMTITVAAGTTTLGFVTYNTGNTKGQTGLFLDNIVVTEATSPIKSVATIIPGNLSTVYDGTPKPVTVTTDPPNLATDMTYDGNATPPTAVGDYTVVATINDATYQGSTSFTYSIGKATATVDLSDLTVTYDGTPKSPTVTTTPPGLGVNFTFANQPGPPTNAGNYIVLVTINDPNYQGITADGFTISPATATLSFSGLTALYDGTPKPVTATTTPAGLGVTLTYNGHSTAPTDVGSYPVVATITDPNYQATTFNDTLVISGSFSGWQQIYSITGAPTDTPQNDSVSNLLKYLYDIDPTQPLTAATQAALPAYDTTTINGTDYLTVTYRQNRNESDLQVQPQTSTDMQTWSPISDSTFPRVVGVDTNGDSFVQYGVPVSGPSRFIRLQVTLP